MPCMNTDWTKVEILNAGILPTLYITMYYKWSPYQCDCQTGKGLNSCKIRTDEEVMLNLELIQLMSRKHRIFKECLYDHPSQQSNWHTLSAEINF